jgi:hypothetical protein
MDTRITNSDNIQQQRSKVHVFVAAAAAASSSSVSWFSVVTHINNSNNNSKYGPFLHCGRDKWSQQQSSRHHPLSPAFIINSHRGGGADGADITYYQ